jgi:hypothetical protein
VAGIFTYLGLFFVQNVFGREVSKQLTQPEPSMVETQTLTREIQNIDMIMPGLLILADGHRFAVVSVFAKRSKAQNRNDLLMHQNQSYNSQKALNDLEINAIQLENTMLSNKLELKRQELNTLLMNISEQRTILENISSQIKDLIGSER